MGPDQTRIEHIFDPQVIKGRSGNFLTQTNVMFFRTRMEKNGKIWMLQTQWLTRPDPSNKKMTRTGPITSILFKHLNIFIGDRQCYRIFEQGPCPHSQELAFNGVTGLAECRCPKSLLFWAATNR